MRKDPAFAAPERSMLEEWLTWHRATVRFKASGLSESGARQTPIPTSPLISVGGLVRHLRWVEHYWFEVVLLGRTNQAPYMIDPENDPDAEWRVPDDTTLVRLLDEYDHQCGRSREIAVAFSLDHRATPRRAGEEGVTVRWILHHMIEETARHNGHLDLLRELADGVKGE